MEKIYNEYYVQTEYGHKLNVEISDALIEIEKLIDFKINNEECNLIELQAEIESEIQVMFAIKRMKRGLEMHRKITEERKIKTEETK